MAFVGREVAGIAAFGHYAAKSGFDFGAANGDEITAQLQTPLRDEERMSVQAAA